ncbi:MAG: hypothetical protein ABW360_06735 [Phenylobacterium sp.]
MDRRLFLIGALALAGCATVRPAAGPLAELEPIYAATAGREALTLQVASGGCTTKADFAFYVERKDGAVTLSFGRKRLDTCKSFAMGKTELTFTWAELGVDEATPVFLLNPLTAWTGP